jgi:hypothetical protein
MTDRIAVFISHISEEAPLAHLLKSWIEATFPGQVSVFVSSDLVSIQAGDEWYDKIMEALGTTSVFIVVCSPISLERPWVNFETGVAAYRDVRIIPVCHRGMVPGKLPQPLHRFQGIDISHATMPIQLMTPIAKMLAMKLHAIPEADMLRAFQMASEGGHTSEKNPFGSSAQSDSAALPTLSAVSRAREVAIQARFDDETVKLLQNGNSAFHEAATKLIDDVELRLKKALLSRRVGRSSTAAILIRSMCATRRGTRSSCCLRISISTRRATLRFEYDSLRGGCSLWSSARP